MKTIVPAKPPVNPYRVGLIALVSACWVVAAGLDALFITLAVVSPGALGWGLLAVAWSVGLLVGTGAIIGWAFEWLERKANEWEPEVSDG